jgi:DNA-binding transcriptional MerR regulator
METLTEIKSDGMINGKKTYYSISEVCGLTGLEPHVLRYWETEFSQLRPKKNRAGNRAYRDKDIEVVKYIKQLLYEEQFTIPGAKKRLAEPKIETAELVSPEPAAIPPIQTEQPFLPSSALPEKAQFRESLKRELVEVLELLTK